MGGLSKPKRGSISPLSSSGPIVGVDFGVGSLKVIEISPGDTPTLLTAAKLDTPPELAGDPAARLTFQLESLPKLVKKAGIRAKRATCSIPAGQTFCKHMQLQRSEGVGVQTLIESALPAQVGVEADKLLCRHLIVGDVGRAGKTEVICLAASRSVVGRLIQGLKAAKLEPVGMFSELEAGLHSFDDLKRRDGDSTESTLYVDLGRASTKIMIAHGSNMVFARGVEFGGLHLDMDVAHQLGCSMEEATQRRLAIFEALPPEFFAAHSAETAGETAASSEDGDQAEGQDAEGGGMAMLNAAMRKDGVEEEAEAGTDEAAVATEEERRRGESPQGFSGDLASKPAVAAWPEGVNLSEPVEILTDEIQMSLRYHQSLFPDRKITRAVFVGGEATNAGLCQLIARSVRLPTQVADPLARLARDSKVKTLNVDLSSPQPGWAVPFGLCMCPADL